MSITYPKICIANDGKYFIDFILNDKRYRLYNGKKIRGGILLFDEYSKYSNIEAVKSFMRTSTFY